jgi:hypothetical protein
LQPPLPKTTFGKVGWLKNNEPKGNDKRKNYRHCGK